MILDRYACHSCGNNLEYLDSDRMFQNHFISLGTVTESVCTTAHSESHCRLGSSYFENVFESVQEHFVKETVDQRSARVLTEVSEQSDSVDPDRQVRVVQFLVKSLQDLKLSHEHLSYFETIFDQVHVSVQASREDLARLSVVEQMGNISQQL